MTNCLAVQTAGTGEEVVMGSAHAGAVSSWISISIALKRRTNRHQAQQTGSGSRVYGRERDALLSPGAGCHSGRLRQLGRRYRFPPARHHFPGSIPAAPGRSGNGFRFPFRAAGRFPLAAMESALDCRRTHQWGRGFRYAGAHAERLKEAEARRESVVYVAHTTKPTDFAIAEWGMRLSPSIGTHFACAITAMSRTSLASLAATMWRSIPRKPYRCVQGQSRRFFRKVSG